MKEIEILIEVKSDKEKALKALEKFTAHGAKRTLESVKHSVFDKLEHSSRTST